ncbi:MAG: hypothetical protein R3F17_11975 [Planctomycetota bacterium]
MNIIACVKRVPTTEATAEISADGKGLDSKNFQYMVSFYDEIAVEQAVQTKEAKGGEVTVLSPGSASGSKEIRECMAKGADKAVLLVDEEWQSRDCRATAKALVAKISELGGQLVFMAKSPPTATTPPWAPWLPRTSTSPALPTWSALS